MPYCSKGAMRGGVKTIFIIVAPLFPRNLVDLILLAGLIPRLAGSGSNKKLLKHLEEERKNALIIRHDF